MNSSNLHFFKTKLQKITKTCAHQADNRIHSQSAKKTAAIFRKSQPTPVTDAAIVPRGTILRRRALIPLPARRKDIVETFLLSAILFLFVLGLLLRR